ncbi:MAG: hypothetical protein AAFZ87_05570 [Planctomycetota bacterium]
MRLAHSLLALAPLVLPASAQDALVLERGDPVDGLPGVEISSIAGNGIASTGDWWAAARYSAPSPGGDLLFVNGATLFRSGEALADGNVFIRATAADFTAAGDVAVLAEIENPSGAGSVDALLWNGSVLASTGTPIVDAAGASVGPILMIEEFALDGAERILAIVTVGPFSLPPEYRLVEIDPANPNEATLLLGGAATYPDGTALERLERVDVNAAGQVMTSGREVDPAGGFPLRAVRLDGELVLKTGDIEPTTGAAWDLEGTIFGLTTVDFDLDASGEVLVYGTLEEPGNVRRALARGDTLVVRGGDTLPGETTPLGQIDPYGASALPDGRVFWSGFEQGGSPKTLYLGDQPYLRQGDAVAGSTLVRVLGATNEEITPFPENGGFFLYHVELEDGRVGLLRRRLSIGRFGCSQSIANSSGRIGRLQAQGSDLAGGHELRLAASDLPPGQFGLFAVASEAGTIFNPGTQGSLCLGGSIGRLGAVQQITGSGTAAFFVDTLALPVSPTVAARPGDTWHFQFWFRDQNPNPTASVTDSVLVTFR